VINVLREEARETTPLPSRQEFGIEDAAIRVASAASAAGTKDAERREVLRDLRPGTTVAIKDTRAVATTTTPGFSSMDEDELQAVDPNTLSVAELDAYVSELERRTPEGPALAEDDADLDDLDWEEDTPTGYPLPWETYDSEYEATND
jgi:hypothetical protein